EEALDAGAHLVEERAHQRRGGVRRVDEGGVQHLMVVREHLAGDRLDQRVLRAELVEDRRARDARRLRDVGHRDLGEAAGGEERARGIEDAFALGAERRDACHGLGSNTDWTRVQPPSYPGGWAATAVRPLARAFTPLAAARNDSRVPVARTPIGTGWPGSPS